MTSKFLTLTLAVALILLVPIVAPAQSEPRGYTCHDCPYYKGEFSITNNTSVTIRYSYRWGTNSTWETSSLRPGVTDTHSYPLGYKRNNTAPPPYISIDRIAGDNYVTNRTIAIGDCLPLNASAFAGHTVKQHWCPLKQDHPRLPIGRLV